MRSSKFRGCGFYLDESQFLNYVCFMFVVMSSEQCFYLLCCNSVAHVDILKTMLWYF
ncbi:hypothetical protein HanRHA438_Chr08g0363061 [Helianthus annuus]|nr:hypothetical protein HanIR_Chr08g0378471 [Helianthus annuus]KAJ0554447.1 hypothetical protein HanHA89_Chr08g0307891 [Helianthus annuus]KAJ0898984.1 hypothetical protein HanRHA438_Chr08g0363061 [Helianthus annuus]